MWEGSDASIALARQEASDVIREGERLGLYQWVTTDLVSTVPIHSTEHITSLNIPAFTDRFDGLLLYNFLEGTAYEAIKLSEDNLLNIYQETGRWGKCRLPSGKVILQEFQRVLYTVKVSAGSFIGIFKTKPHAFDPSSGNVLDRGRELFARSKY